MMKKKHISLSISLLVILAVMAMIGCDSSGTFSPVDATVKYILNGLLIKDMNQDRIHSAVAVLKNDSTYSSAIVLFGSDSLEFNHALGLIDSTYSHQVSPVTRYPAANYALNLIDSDSFNDTIIVTVADTFSILTVVPGNRQWRPLDGNVSLTWSGSNLTESYILVAVKADLAYSGVGYSAYANEFATSGSIIALDAFYTSTGAEVDTGMYYLYVYAYTGSPDKVLGDQLLPTALPSQLADNIAEKNLSGHFGQIVVTAFDSIHVVTQ